MSDIDDRAACVAAIRTLADLIEAGVVTVPRQVQAHVYPDTAEELFDVAEAIGEQVTRTDQGHLRARFAIGRGPARVTYELFKVGVALFPGDIIVTREQMLGPSADFYPTLPIETPLSPAELTDALLVESAGGAA